jgi:hypothetical protein
VQIKTRVAGIVAVSASAVALMAAPAFAQSGPSGNVTGVGNLGILNGNAVNVPITAPINLCGGAIAILGFANAHCVGGAEATVVNDSTIENYGFGF